MSYDPVKATDKGDYYAEEQVHIKTLDIIIIIIIIGIIIMALVMAMMMMTKITTDQ